MTPDADALVTPPSIAKTASIATHGRSWGDIGATGRQSHVLKLPFMFARSLVPDTTLVYDSNAGNGKCGLGWSLSEPAIRRKTSTGVPKYLATDVMLADGTELRPELTVRGTLKTRKRTRGKGRSAQKFAVVNYLPRLESTFSRYELWKPAAGGGEFWIVYGADGSQSCYGNSTASRLYDPDQPEHIAEWLLVEIMNAVGEHVYFEYKADNNTPPDPRFDYRAQRYLRQICYGNETASTELICLKDPAVQDRRWYFRAILDYGERPVTLDAVPLFSAPEDGWPIRNDPSRMHRYGFELGTRRLCRQFLMYNNIGAEKVLVNRLLLEYQNTALHYSQLKAAHYMSYDATGRVKHSPPIEYYYKDFVLNTTPQPFLSLDHMPGLNDRATYYCVDLYGEGLPGFLCQYENAWYYREPLRGEPGTAQIVYGPWTLLPLLPNADLSKPMVQILTDLTGDGCLNWVIAQPGMSGYYTLNPDHTWSLFQPFKGFPLEFFHLSSQLGDFSGDGLDSVAIINPNNVRVYPNLREAGFARGHEEPHTTDRLPVFGPAPTEQVFLGNLHASDLSGLCRIRHDQVECWANLGHGRFGEGFKLGDLPYSYDNFNTEQMRVADLDGSGAPAVIYLKSDHFEIWFNHGGNGLASTPVRVPWPAGVRYDNLCQVTFADLQGLGCASLLLTVPHMQSQHWVYHFASERPYLLEGCNNNMGYSATLGHVSSAQRWLDEKQQLLSAGKKPVCHLPFPQQVLAWLRQDDEITGNYLMQFWEYFEGYYDRVAREFRGFARVYQTDSEQEPSKAASGHTAPTKSKRWFHTGQRVYQVLLDICLSDDEYTPLGLTLYSPLNKNSRRVRRGKADSAEAREIAYALSGRLLRTEVSQADDPTPARLFSLSEVRYRVCQIHEKPSSLLVQELESRSFDYERFMNDPRCQHAVNLAWDLYGMLVHSITVDCARRRTDTDEPPFEEEDQRRAWQDSHDEQQRWFYLSESRADFIHLTGPRWHLGLPSRQRSNAFVLQKGTLPLGLSPAEISFEHFTPLLESAAWNGLRELTTLARHTYAQDTDGKMHYPPLPGPVESAVFDKKALAAYDGLALDIRAELRQIGYQPMKLFFPVDAAEDALENLWSAQSGFFGYAGAADFYQVGTVQQTASHGVTQVIHDPLHLLVSAIILPDGCKTEVEHEYHTLLPLRSTDANENISEVLYEPGGQPMVHSFHGTENGGPAGFKGLADYPLQLDLSPEYALAHPQEVIASAAGVVRTQRFSWMPLLPHGSLPLKRKEWIAKGLMLPNGRVRATALRWLTGLKKRTASEQTLLKLFASTARQPVHSVNLTADRYHDDPLQLIQIIIQYIDGFGRELQSKQLVDPGLAYVATDEDTLMLDAAGKLLEAQAEPRFRVIARVEYNHKGEAIREYRPYFLNSHRCINDISMREHGHYDQLFYDAQGRQIKTINALGHLAYSIFHPWFKCDYDYNDTDDSPAKNALKPAKKPAVPAGKPAKSVKKKTNA
jgi:hypothetical protein